MYVCIYRKRKRRCTLFRTLFLDLPPIEEAGEEEIEVDGNDISDLQEGKIEDVPLLTNENLSEMDSEVDEAPRKKRARKGINQKLNF